MMVFCPTTITDLRAARESGRLQAVGYAPTAEMMAAHGLTDRDQEDAAFTAQTYAATASLCHTGRRVVVAVETDDLTTCDRTDVGEVRVDVSWRGVRAFFLDDPAVSDVVTAGRQVAGMDWLEAWERPDVQALVNHDLLWYDPSELDTVEA